VIQELGERLDAEHIVRRIGWAVWIVLLLSLGTFCVQGANRPKDPKLAPTPSSSSSPVRRRMAGFGEVAFRVNGGPPACAAVADTAAARQQGLMARHDLGGYDGMLFRFSADTRTTFFMRNTPLPLSIAWFDGAGRYVSQADMSPCPDIDGCPEHAASGPYRDALEVPQGHLSTLGIVPGSTMTIGGPCT
jgi:uncharacterized membrane protein (UPF0127 family)